MSVLGAYARIIQSATSDTAASPSLTDVREVGAAIERARVVGVLDAWVARRSYNARRHESQLDVCVLVDCDAGQRIFTGADQDAARAAAAKAIEEGSV